MPNANAQSEYCYTYDGVYAFILNTFRFNYIKIKIREKANTEETKEARQRWTNGEREKEGKQRISIYAQLIHQQ